MTSKKYPKYIIIFIGILIVYLGFHFYGIYEERQIVKEAVIEEVEEKIPQNCENGEWVTFPDLENSAKNEKFAENIRIKYVEEKEIFSNEDGSKTFTTDKKYSLFFFIDRDIRVEGYKLSENEIYVQKIKCVGVEANKDIQSQRRKIMDYVSRNINSLALEKSDNGQWQVGTFYFANDADLYVQYETEKSFMEEAPYDSHLWLIRVSKLDRDVPVIETLAYIEENAEDPEKNILKKGEDLHKDVKNLIIYEFDEEANQWVLQ